jgi:DNA (cytosine-5)-methyltransferase 1
MTPRLNTISLFTGGGGMDLGFAAAGYSICLATDIDSYSCKTLELNFGKKRYYRKHAVVVGDINEITTSRIIKLAGKRANEIDLIMGGPPCQAFSVFGKRAGVDDPRGQLVWQYLRLVKEIAPKAFVFENVAGLKSIHDGQLYQNLLKALSLDGQYVVSAHNYNVAELGIPQFRNRILFIGYKKGKRIPQMNPTHGDGLLAKYPYVTVGKVLKNMPEPTDDISNHKGREHSQVIIDRYTKLKYGERDSKTRINKLHPDRPSFTIVVGSDAGGGKGHVHPFTPREVTPRESARLQTFPDWWRFYGTGRHVIRQVGNAVPPLFAALLADHIKRFVFASTKHTSYQEYIDKLDLEFLKS